MSEISQDIQKKILESLDPDALGQVDIVSIPKSRNRLMQLRTLEEVIDDFEMENTSNSFTYVVKVKPGRRVEKPEEQQAVSEIDIEKLDIKRPTEVNVGEIYETNGKLNRDFLTQNAEVLLRSKNYKDAQKIFETLIRGGIKTGKILNGLGVCYENEQKLLEAQESFEEAIAFESAFSYYRNLYRVLRAQNRNEYAFEILERALTISDLADQQKLMILKELGKKRVAQKNYDKGLENLHAALKMDPNSDDTLTQIGSVSLKTGKLDIAIDHFEKAEEKNPNNARAIFGLGCCHLIKGEKRLAFKCFIDSLKINLLNPTAIYYLVKCAFELKRFEEAIPVVKEYTQSSPINPNLLYCLAGMQFHAKRKGEVLITVDRLLNLRPDHPGGLKLKRLALNQMK